MQTLFYGRLLTKREVEKTLLENDLDPAYETVWSYFDQEVALTASEGCGRCGNQHKDLMGSLPAQPLFGLTKNHLYCLNCLQMGRITSRDSLYYLADPGHLTPLAANPLTWEGTLSKEQDRAAKDLVASLADPRPHLITAVTGAGKTEMIFPIIGEVLQKGGRVVVASPRIDVCLELAPRIQAAFQGIDLALLYGGADVPYRYTPLVVSTTHQLLRFQAAFDLVIVDEVDAFPYAGDESLHYAVRRSVKKGGKTVYLTATPDETLEAELAAGRIASTTLPARYHGHPLVEPKFRWIGNWRLAVEHKRRFSPLIRLLKKFLALEGVQLIFMPDIRLAEALFAWLKDLMPDLPLACVHAKDPDRKDKVQALRDGKLKALVTTTILERGVTFTNCQVCIVGAEDRLYTVAALVQMSGRVGRRPDYPSGELIFAHGGRSRSMLEARAQIQTMNRQARQRGLIQ